MHAHGRIALFKHFFFCFSYSIYVGTEADRLRDHICHLNFLRPDRRWLTLIHDSRTIRTPREINEYDFHDICWRPLRNNDPGRLTSAITFWTGKRRIYIISLFLRFLRKMNKRTHKYRLSVFIQSSRFSFNKVLLIKLIYITTWLCRIITPWIKLLLSIAKSHYSLTMYNLAT